MFAYLFINQPIDSWSFLQKLRFLDILVVFRLDLGEIGFNQEPITRSVQLPYSVCETAFSQVGLVLDKPVTVISLRYFFNAIGFFHFFWILFKLPLNIANAREKLTKSGFNRKNSHAEICIKGMLLLHLYMWKMQLKRMEL